MDDAEEANRRYELLKLLPEVQRELIGEIAGLLCDLSFDKLEFVELAALAARAYKDEEFDPLPICAALCKRWRDRRKEN